ncbi:MAG: aminotransferase class III-fold pyridoxal phosphate-dependent enzyme [Burkholderiales bacterium]
MSTAKHPSLAGHPRIARWIARRIPRFRYDRLDALACDGAPPGVVERRRSGLGALEAEFASRFAAGRALAATGREVLSDLRFTSAYRVPMPFATIGEGPLRVGTFVAETRGVRIVDIDGNESYEVSGSYGVNLFGHEFYKRCMADGAALVRDLGPVLGPYHPVVVSNARKLAAISGQDEVSFHMSGTEAVMQAVRLARYHTKRRRIVCFAGAYHGWWGDVAPGVGNPVAARDTYVLREMDERTLRVLRSRRDIACVLVNPIQALHPNRSAPTDSGLVGSRNLPAFDRTAYAQWLRALREVCDARGIALVFDEVFVGFRIARGGAQEYFGVRADLVTYGKTVGGGLPIGVVCGRAGLMRRFRDERPADVCLARGTFNSHPYVMGAMHAFLEHLDRPQTHRSYEALDATWDHRASRFNEAIAAAGFPLEIRHLASIWSVAHLAPSRFNWMLQYYLRLHGIALSWIGTGRLIFSHDYTDDDVQAVTDRFLAACEQMREDGFWWHPAGETARGIGRGLLRDMARARWRAQPSPIMPAGEVTPPS